MESLVQLKNQCEKIPVREAIDLIDDMMGHCDMIDVDCTGPKGCRGGPPTQCSHMQKPAEGPTKLAEVVTLTEEIGYTGYCLQSVAGGGWTFVNEAKRSTTDINDVFPEQLGGCESDCPVDTIRMPCRYVIALLDCLR